MNRQKVRNLSYLKGDINKIMDYDCNAYKKFTYIKNKFSYRQDDIKLAREDEDYVYDELKELVEEKFEELVSGLSSLTQKIEVFDLLTTFFDLEENSELFNVLEEVKKDCNNLFLKKIDIANKCYESNLPVLAQDIFSNMEYGRYLKKGFISSDTDLKIKELESKIKGLDCSKFNYLINNLFNAYDCKTFKEFVNLGDKKVSDSVINEVFEENKCGFDDKIYILTFRLGKELFKEAIGNMGLNLINLKEVGFYGYACKNPYLLLNKLIEEGILTKYSKETDANDEAADLENILLWSGGMEKPREYFKGIVDGKLYYVIRPRKPKFIKVEYEDMMHYKIGPYTADAPQYLIGYDDLTNKGFVVIPPLSIVGSDVERTVNRMFKLDEGFKHLISNVSIREFTYEEAGLSEDEVAEIKYVKVKINDNLFLNAKLVGRSGIVGKFTIYYNGNYIEYGEDNKLYAINKA